MQQLVAFGDLRLFLLYFVELGEVPLFDVLNILGNCGFEHVDLMVLGGICLSYGGLELLDLVAF